MQRQRSPAKPLENLFSRAGWTLSQESCPRGAAGTNLRRYRSGVVRGSRILLFLLLAAAGAQVASAGSPDRTPPTFGGLVSATTCIPGPVGGDRMSSYRLTWAAAKDR